MSWNSTYWEGSPVTDFPAVNEETVSDSSGFVDFDWTVPEFPTDSDGWDWDLDEDNILLDPSQLTAGGEFDISLDPTVTLDGGDLELISAAASETTAAQPAQEDAASAPLRNRLYLPMVQR